MHIFRLHGLKLGILQVSLFFIVYFLILPACYAQAPEQITITTYYPSPYGVYQALEARRLAVGTVDATHPMPDVNNATTDGVAIFRGQGPGNPTWASDGALYYNSSSHQFRYYNGTAWVPLGICKRNTFAQNTGRVYCPPGTAIVAAVIGMPRSGSYLCCPYQ